MMWITPEHEEIKSGGEVTEYVNPDPGESLLEAPRAGAAATPPKRAPNREDAGRRPRR